MQYPSQAILAAIYEHQKKSRTGHSVATTRCARCNDLFYYRPSKEPRRLYCEQCQSVVDTERKKKQYRHHYPQIESACEYCGGSFLSKRNDSRYCSGKCRQAAYRVRKNQSVTRSIQR